MDESTTAPKKSSLPLVGIIVLVAALLLGAMLMRNNNTGTQTAQTNQEVTQAPETQTTPATEESPTEENMAADSDVTEFTLEAGSFYYKPNEIRVKQGDKVRVVINSVSMMHDFKIDELGVSIPVTKMGETGSVEFTADKAGTYEFYCSVGQHRANGQVGTLIVE